MKINRFKTQNNTIRDGSSNLFSIFFMLPLLLTFSFAQENQYSTYPSKNSLNLVLNSPILLNPKADKYHKAFFRNLSKAQLFLQKSKKLAFTKDEEIFLKNYQINFKNIEVKKGLLSGNERDIAAQNFKYDAVKLSDSLSLNTSNSFDISFIIRDVLENSIVLEGYRTIYEEGKFSFSEFYTITLDKFNINSFSECVNLLRFIILNPMKPYINKKITPEPKETVIQNYAEDTIKQISYNNKPQSIKVYTSNTDKDQYILSSYFKLGSNKIVDYNGDNEVLLTLSQAKEYCSIFDMQVQVDKKSDTKYTFKCIGTQQKNINYIPKYALKDTKHLMKLKPFIANKKETIVYNKEKNINEIWDLELGVKVFTFKHIYELLKYDLPKDAKYILLDENYKKSDSLINGKQQFFLYESAGNFNIIDSLTQKFYTDIQYKASIKKKIIFDSNKLMLHINRDVYKLFEDQGFAYKSHIAKYVIDTYIDKTTKLMWQNNDGLKKLTYKDAQSYCQNLRVGFLDDWRVPSSTELQTIKSKRGYTHEQSISNRTFIIKELFNSSKIEWQYFWTTDSNDIDANKRLGISFNYPNNKMWYNQTKELYVRCVREYK